MKKLVTVVMVVAFALSAGSVMAGSVSCTVDSIDGDKVTMTCKKADKLKVGDKVKVKAGKKKAIEGC
jgi:ABC-type transporter Mla subunit MlaD